MRYGYETTSYTGRDYEERREAAAQLPGGGIGRPRGAAARVAGHGPDAATREMHADWRDELMKLKTRLLELS